MSSWFILICYLLFAYGCSVIVTQGIGPKNIFFRLRMWAESIGPNFGMLFRCMMCFPANLGIVVSLLNWFLLPMFPITPFNMVFSGFSGWLMGIITAVMDGCITSGVCHFLWNLDDFIEKSTPLELEDINEEEEENNGQEE